MSSLIASQWIKSFGLFAETLKFYNAIFGTGHEGGGQWRQIFDPGRLFC